MAPARADLMAVTVVAIVTDALCERLHSGKRIDRAGVLARVPAELRDSYLAFAEEVTDDIFRCTGGRP